MNRMGRSRPPEGVILKSLQGVGAEGCASRGGTGGRRLGAKWEAVSAGETVSVGAAPGTESGDCSARVSLFSPRHPPPNHPCCVPWAAQSPGIGGPGLRTSWVPTLPQD